MKKIVTVLVVLFSMFSTASYAAAQPPDRNVLGGIDNEPGRVPQGEVGPARSGRTRTRDFAHNQLESIERLEQEVAAQRDRLQAQRRGLKRVREDDTQSPETRRDAKRRLGQTENALSQAEHNAGDISDTREEVQERIDEGENSRPTRFRGQAGREISGEISHYTYEAEDRRDLINRNAEFIDDFGNEVQCVRECPPGSSRDSSF